MAATSLFDFQDYKQYLKSYIGAQPGNGRGFRARMATVMRCQRSFVSRVLTPRSAADLSLEQAIQVSLLIGHAEEEQRYFLLLVHLARAGSEPLKRHVRNQLKEILNRRLQSKEAKVSRQVLTPEEHMRYYSSWHFAALRVAVAIPELQTQEALSSRLGLPAETIRTALEFLVSCGLVEKKGSHYSHKSHSQIHLTPEHPLVSKHHANWRIRALSALEREASHDLHYTYVVTMSEEDALSIRSFIVEMLQEIQKRTQPSPPKTAYGLCLDYFEV